jgi:hypothetical protein
MSYYHIIIAVERRTQPERMAQVITSEETVVQLHSAVASALPENLADTQFVMVAEWDGTSPYVIQHKGDYSARNMGYAGWPDLTHEQWVSQQADQMGVS